MRRSGGRLREQVCGGGRRRLGRVRPHAFRHGFATAVLDASGGNLVIARDAGGWASTTVVSETYAHANVHDPAFEHGSASDIATVRLPGPTPGEGFVFELIGRFGVRCLFQDH